MAAQSSWNSLEIAKLVVGVLTPVTVAVLGAVFARALKRAETRQWFNQKLVEKRVDLIGQLLPELNDLLCYYTWVGEWQTTAPPDIIARKRRLDRLFHANRSFFSGAAAAAYGSFMDGLFQTYVAPGQGPRLRTGVTSRHGDRRKAFGSGWRREWAGLFLPDGEQTSREEVRRRYDALVGVLGAEIGVTTS
ncbi:hypothetical protein GCM10010168_63260 [Actinoplanes ianthinogenes]|uniref:Uncharacterized protein n=1 Tax=Actinoplanes ianthinogenes TaxID=122358 RepID=A0ABM7LJJ9_9ACTN|nr:hypothetical protein [Actinoplanes ianthinogenes]BCJ39426.1 hypothetical protein Aiant_00830 [Actinoplanes ianthinogenes]GGR36191.1 hypothetical protein GCM10010168_63260 [Actinoplanes ianthinogenes]